MKMKLLNNFEYTFMPGLFFLSSWLFSSEWICRDYTHLLTSVSVIPFRVWS